MKFSFLFAVECDQRIDFHDFETDQECHKDFYGLILFSGKR